MALELFNHNKEAYERVQEHLKKSNKTCVIQPTGTGKSFISLKFLDDNLDKKCLLVAPTYPILDQFKKNIVKYLLNIPVEDEDNFMIDSILEE